MRKFFTIAILAIISANLFAQKVNKTYWGYTSVVHEEYQVNSSGVKNGYYKEYSNEGEIFKTGSYTNGQKSGLWTTYDMNWSGQISSTMEYSNNKMNGQYKQWCWEKSKRYLCGDYIYKDDEEIKGKQYFSNGQLKYDRDHEKGIYKEWFEDGSAKVETINGKHFTFEWSNSKRNVTSIKFDSLGNNYEYYYDSYGFYLRTITVSQGDVLINIDYNSIANPKVKVKEKNSENSWYYTPEIQLDST